MRVATTPLTPSTAGDWLATRDARLRILAAVAFALVTVGLERLPALLLALILAAAAAAAGGLTLGNALRRLAPLAGLLAILFATLPLMVPGTPWLELGPLSASYEGLREAVQIALKASAVVLAMLGLVGSLDPATLGHALARLGLPDKLVHLFLFTVRYIDVLHGEYRRLRQALRARAFVPRSDAHTWRTLGWLVGMLLVRSLERARRVTAAMKCRGFAGRFYRLDQLAWHRGDTAAALGAGATLALLFLLGRPA
ncbi:cobalt ECF transporter T component CbiQ [Thiococcus pfennigii]|uniref:cobalt ECF transporter T component CbiQ n=1 Tax=Thiococcus pfennigii TaxID=1057 RepID=UPI0019058E26|nr:cobalt ECF transporter T component CbiQ [Thiococcus pfennigii]MBK1702108.1 cobalt ECF transporter T component CbiQ [Thiococcus pfennigii]